ncbi:MAG: hypothetical protein ACREOP_12070 [Thermodesulfobacteriota bacterium]
MRGKYIAGLAVIFLLLTFLISHAATNLNSSKSNVYRLIYPTDAVSQAQAAAILADLDAATQQSQGRINLEGAVSQALTKQGLGTQIKKTIIKPASAAGQLTTIIILSNPADEAQAIAVADEGVPADKPTKGKKTN